MASHIALDRLTNDIMFHKTGVVHVTDGRFVVQQVRSKLKTIRGEWVLDRSIGFIKQDDAVKNYDPYEIESRATEIILGTQGVLSVTEVTQSFKNRKLTISFQAKTIYGEISSEVEW